MVNIYIKTRILSAFFAVFVVFLQPTTYNLQPNIVSAQTTDSVQTESNITISDLGIINPGMLPTSPFYFLKQWGRNFRRTITFNPIKKVELELNIANAKVAELKKVAEVEENNAEAVKKALKNYQSSQEKLKTRLELLKETSENPNVKKLLENLTERVVKHQRIVEGVVANFKDNQELNDVAKIIKEDIAGVVGKAAEKDEPEKFAAKMEKALRVDGVACIELYKPICGIDDKTYSNSCYMERAGIKIQYEGACKIMEPGTTPNDVKDRVPPVCPDFARPNPEIEAECKSRGGEMISKTSENGCKLQPMCTVLP